MSKSHIQLKPQKHPSKPMSRGEFYRLIRERIDYEENLINQRVIWLVFSQSFLVSAYAIVLNSPPQPKSPIYADQQSSLLWLLPGVALASSIVIYSSVLSAIYYISELGKSFESYPKDDTADRFPPIHDQSLIRQIGALPPILVPLLFIGTWCFLLIKQFLVAQ